MYGSKLLDVLACLEAGEWKELEVFLKSPYFNRNPDLLRLAMLLKKEAPGFKEERVDRYLLMRKLFPKRALEDKEIRYLMSSLLKLVERFLGQQVYETKPLLGGSHVLEACEARNLKKHYRQQLRQLEKLTESHPYRDEHYYYHRFLRADVETRYFHRQGVRTYDHNLQETVDYLDEFYLITKLRLTCELINRQNILSASYDIRLVDELLGYLEGYDFEKVPAIAMYYHILRLLTAEDTHPHFQSLKGLMVNNFHLFPEHSQKEIFSYAQNHCIKQIKNGVTAYHEELFGIYQEGLKTGLLIEEGVLSPWKFKNIVSNGLGLGKFEWVENFIDTFNGKILEEFRETALVYNRAHLYYHQGRFSEALKTLNTVEFSDIFYALGTRKIMLMIYFEQEEVESLLSLVSSFKLFLRRNKLISEGNRRAYLNFVNLVQALFRYREGKGEQRAELEKQIRETQPLVEESWLMKMLDCG